MPQLLLPAGSTYRIFASRGTEWSIASTVVSPVAGDTPDELEFRLRRVVDTSGYIASEYHVHSIGSPDSPIPNDRRVATAVADGIEFYATTDHDFVVQQQPIIEMLGLDRLVRSIGHRNFAAGLRTLQRLAPQLRGRLAQRRRCRLALRIQWLRDASLRNLPIRSKQRG